MGKKIAIWGGGAIVVVVIVVIGGIMFFGGDAVKAAVERLGPPMTQTTVTLDKVDLSLTSGEGRMSKLFVGNPEGFKSDSAFQLGEIAVKVDTGTVTSDVIVINEIVIDAPEVTYELAGSGNNLQTIQRNIAAYTGGGGSGGGSSSEDGKKLIIENLYVRGGKINVAADFLAGRDMGAALPDIHLKDIGKEKQGATPAEVAKRIIDSITGQATQAVSALDLEGLSDAAREAMKGATTAIGEGAAGATGAVEEGAGSAADKVKGLFGSD